MENQTLEQLKERATLIGRYYCKGFGDCINFTTNTVEKYVEAPERRDLVDRARASVEMINEFYAKIPFVTLKQDEAFFPLFIVRDLLVNYNRDMELAFDRREEWLASRVRGGGIAMVKVGEIYRATLRRALESARAAVGGQDFKISMVDLMGKTWNLGAI